MDSSGQLYAGTEAQQLLEKGATIESDKGIIEITKEQYEKYSAMTQEERIAEYQKLVEYNKNVNTRQVRRARERYGR